MFFTWVLGFIGAGYSAVMLVEGSTAIDFFSGFIAGALIDLYRLLKKIRSSINLLING